MKNILTLIAVVLTLTCYSTTITVTNPVGGETFIVGQTINVTWTWTQNLPKVKIELYESNAAAWRVLADSIVNTGSYSFVASGSAAQQQNTIWQSSIRITKVDSSGVSGISNPFFIAFPPLVAKAGNDATINCGVGGVSLGGSPVASGAITPYTYRWSPSVGLHDSTVARPFARPLTTTTYVLTVIDSVGTIAKDTVKVNVLPSVQVDAGTDIVTCSAAQVALNATVIAANYCNGSAQSGPTGTDTLIYTQNFSQRPSLAGNFLKSYRNQMLYTAAELNTLLGGAKTIKGIEFQIAQHGFAGSAQVQNYRISLGNTSQDSLAGSFNNTLTTVLTLPSYQPYNGWNYLSFNIGFVWDGVSNVIVEICSYNPTTFGSQPNSAECSSTAFSSYCYALSNSDLCGINGVGTTSNIRPNIKLRYCDTEYVPYTLNWTPSSGLSNASIANPIANPVSNTTYTISVIDSNGCTASDTVRITVSPSVIAAVDSVVNASCLNVFDGSLKAIGSAGHPPYTYSLDGNLLQSSPYFNALSAGNYVIYVYDTLGCYDTVTATINPSSGVALSIFSFDSTSCYGIGDGSITLQLTGGYPPYSYSVVGVIFQPSGVFTDLTPGDYTAIGTDSRGCNDYIPFTIQASAPYPIDTAIITNVTCNGASNGAIDLTMVGSTSNYTYLWSPGGDASEDLIGLVPNRYSVTITDTAGCQITDSFDINEPAVLSATLSHTDATCGLNNGTLTITIAGGTPPYTYLGNPTPAGTSTITSLPADIYTGNVTDANGCTIAVIDTILQMGSSNIISITNDGDGIYPDTLGVTVSGGCAPYQYTWSNGEQNPTTQALSNGIYGITVTDCQGCSSTAAINLGPLAVNQISLVDVTCYGLAIGSASLDATGGIPPYQFSIDGGTTFQSSGVFTNLTAGRYFVAVTDAAAGVVIDSFTITDPGQIYTSGFVRNVSCFGFNDGAIDITAFGGILPYNFAWSDSLYVTQDLAGLAGGVYVVTVTDYNGCSILSIYEVIEPPLLQAHLVSATGGALPDTLSAVVTGGVYMTYEYLASNLSTDSSTYMDLSAQGSCFWVMVTDSNGCQAVTDTFCYTCTDQCVWPGDANYDGVADNNDLLPIGLAYGNIGPARSQIDLGWYAHNAANWIDTLSNGANYKHIDCDGNGVVDSNDTLAIIQNYALVHAKNEDEEPWRANAPELYVRLVPDTTHTGDTLYANLILGNTNIPANSVYGLAFTVNYDALVVDSTKTRATFGTSWLGTATDKISIAKDLPANGQIKCAVTRIDHTTRSGNGQIGQVTFVITTDNINGKDFGYYNTRVWISDVLMIDNNGIELPLNAGRDSTLVEFEPLSVGNIKLEDNSMAIQPNPAANAVQLSVTRELIGAEIRLTDLSGRLLKAMPVTALNLNINTSELAGGIYLVQAISAKGTITKRLIIAR